MGGHHEGAHIYDNVERIAVTDHHIFFGDIDGIVYSYTRDVPEGIERTLLGLDWDYSGSIWGLEECGQNIILGWCGKKTYGVAGQKGKKCPLCRHQYAMPNGNGVPSFKTPEEACRFIEAEETKRAG